MIEFNNYELVKSSIPLIIDLEKMLSLRQDFFLIRLWDLLQDGLFLAIHAIFFAFDRDFEANLEVDPREASLQYALFVHRYEFEDVALLDVDGIPDEALKVGLGLLHHRHLRLGDIMIATAECDELGLRVVFDHHVCFERDLVVPAILPEGSA